MPCWRRKWRLPTSTRGRAIGLHAETVDGSKASAESGVRPRALAPATMASPIGCSESCSTPATSRQRFRFGGPRDKIGQRRMPESQRAGLDPPPRFDVAHALDGLGIAEQKAGARALPHGDGHGDGALRGRRHRGRRMINTAMALRKA